MRIIVWCIEMIKVARYGLKNSSQIILIMCISAFVRSVLHWSSKPRVALPVKSPVYLEASGKSRKLNFISRTNVQGRVLRIALSVKASIHLSVDDKHDKLNQTLCNPCKLTVWKRAFKTSKSSSTSSWKTATELKFKCIIYLHFLWKTIYICITYNV